MITLGGIVVGGRLFVEAAVQSFLQITADVGGKR